MSYWVNLADENGTVAIPPHKEGGTYLVGGTSLADLSVTWNYSWFYYRFLDKEDGLRWLDGKSGKCCIGRLEQAIDILGTGRYKDYWAPTAGNAGHALSILLSWAKQYPDAVFSVS